MNPSGGASDPLSYIGGQVVAGVVGYESQQSANDANRDMSREAMQNANQQAELLRIYNRQQANTAMDFNASQADIARKWSEQMSNSAYQRQMEDMRKAGLNPMLAVGSGGAGTPSGEAASTSPVTGSMPQSFAGHAEPATDLGRGISAAVSTALQVKALNKELQQKDANIALTNASKVVADTEAEVKAQSARQIKAEADIRESEVPYAESKAAFNADWSALKNWMGLIGEGSGLIKDAATAGAAARFGFKGVSGSSFLPPVSGGRSAGRKWLKDQTYDIPRQK